MLSRLYRHLAGNGKQRQHGSIAASLMLDDMLLPMKITTRTNSRRITLRYRNGGLQVSVPPHIANYQIDQFIERQQDWIRNQHQRYLQQRRELAAAPAIWYQGKLHQVRLRQTEIPGARIAGVQSSPWFETTADGITLLLPQQNRASPARILETLLRKQARLALIEELDDILPRLGLPKLETGEVTSGGNIASASGSCRKKGGVAISIRDQQSRWGSCSSRRRLSFNWRLIMAPPACLRYLAVHEAAHLLEHNHGPGFWQLVERLMPDYRHHQDWLTQHQAELFLPLSLRLAGLEPAACGTLPVTSGPSL